MDKILLENEIDPILFKLWKSYDDFKVIMLTYLNEANHEIKIQSIQQIIQLAAFSKNILDKFVKFFKDQNSNSSNSILKILNCEQIKYTLSYMQDNYLFQYQEFSLIFNNWSLQTLDSMNQEKQQIQFEKARRIYLIYKYQYNFNHIDNDQKKLEEILKENFYCFLIGSKHSESQEIYEDLKQKNDQNYLELFMDKSIEIQTLIGNYIIGSNPKDNLIMWKDGPLLNALQNEKILILKNFELAQNSVQSFIINLVQQGFCIFKNKKIYFRGQFRMLIFTENLDSVTDSSLLKISFVKNNLQQLIDSEINNNVSHIKNLIFQFLTLYDIKDFTLIKLFIKRIQQVIQRYELDHKDQFLSTQIQQYILQDFLDIFNEGKAEKLIKKSKNLELSQIFNTSEHQLKILIEQHDTDYQQSKKIIIKRFQKEFIKNKTSFVYTEENSVLINKLITSIEMNENVLLIGETGTGKTRVIQELSELYGQKLNVFNLSYSTDSIDIFGGFRPINNEIFFQSQIFELEVYMKKNFDLKKNESFFKSISVLLNQKDYEKLTLALLQACQHLEQKKQSDIIKTIRTKLEQFQTNPNQFQEQNRFQFVKGILWQCIEKDEWILFDEINMAQEEILFKLYQILSENKISLMDSNQLTQIQKQKNFRIFACMNPAYEIGKKPLPQKIQQQFINFWYPGIQSVQEIFILLKASFKDLPHYTSEILMNFAKFFYWLRQETKSSNILDQGQKKIVISVRQLKRSIGIIINAMKCKQMRTSLINTIYIGLRISCYLSMNKSSRKKFDQKFNEIFNINEIQTLYTTKSFLFINPDFKNKNGFIEIENHCIQAFNNHDINDQFQFIMTPTIKNIMSDILKVLIFDQNLPVLLEGPTSTGKTTVIKYLGNAIGQRVVRINNHKDTDLDEYIGKFTPTKTGKIKFQEGQLIECMRKGYWLLLDELNLAKSEVLEALNRVFDDNQELYVPELDQIIIPHKNFRIFATQNPNTYSGRSLLSKAFKNRFICINYDTMTSYDIQQIIVQKCQLPESRVEIMVKIKDKLQYIKTQENLLNNTTGLVTVRDLIKWANRKQNLITKYDLIYWGFALLGERIRNYNQRNIVKDIFTQQAGISTIDMNIFYKEQFDILKNKFNLQQYTDIKWTFQFKKVFVLANQCIENKEPILLVGETGCGKTTLASLFSKIYNTEYYYLNCHKNTEVNDFIGNWRPKRNKDAIQQQIIELLKQNNITTYDIQNITQDQIQSINNKDKSLLIDLVQQLKQEFEWVNGKLIQAIQNGGVFLIDEISLASDSVLERFNSLFEFERKLFITESEESISIELNAHDKFFIVGTMNPSGDHGKKELSPALRNRFSEIWMQSILDKENFIQQNQQQEVKEFLLFQIQKFSNLIEGNATNINEYLYDLCKFYNLDQHNIFKQLTTRDIQSFISIVNNNITTIGFENSIQLASNHFFESSLGQNINQDFKQAMQNQIYKFTKEYPQYFKNKLQTVYKQTSDTININNITIKINQQQLNLLSSYVLDDPKVTENLYKILLGLQTQKPLMLEGPPGVGKTSLIQILAKLYNKKLYKVNIFAQTDMMDLLGTDVPDQQRIGHFKWCNGILLKAMIEGAWIIFDELNLASQNVLEGLNGILDHRGEVFIPELNKVITKVNGFQFFATQNPQSQGRGRKALPQSFLNRFFKIYLTEIPIDSLIQIAKQKLIEQEQYKTFKNFYDFIQLLLQKNLLQQRQFNIRAFDRIKLFFYTYYDGQNNDLLISIALRLFVLQQNWQKIENIDKILKIAQNFQIKFDLQIATDNDQLCLYNNEFNKVILNFSKNYLKNYDFQDTFSLILLLNQALCVQLNLPMLFIYEETTHRIKQSLKNLSQQHRKQIKILHLYKNADEQDLLGFYDQFGWEQYLEQTMLSKDQKNQVKNLANFKEQQINLLKHIYQQSQAQKLKSQIESLIDLIEKDKQFFKWQDSELIKAVENGDWIFLEGCESCSPALLEKLNGLLEDDFIVINECFIDSKTVRKVIKHKEFRIFLLFKNKKNLKISAPLQNRCYVFIEDQQEIINKSINIFDKNFETYKMVNYLHKEKQLQNIIQNNETKDQPLENIVQQQISKIFNKKINLKVQQKSKFYLEEFLEQIFYDNYKKLLDLNNSLIKQDDRLQLTHKNYQQQIKLSYHDENNNLYILLLQCFQNLLYFQQQNQNMIKLQDKDVNEIFQESQFIKQLYVYSSTQPKQYKNLFQTIQLMINEIKKIQNESNSNLIQQIDHQYFIQHKVYNFMKEIKELIQKNYKECQEKLKIVFQQFYDQQEYENMSLDFFNQNDNSIYLCLLQNKLDLSQSDDNLQVEIFDKFDKGIQFLQQFQQLEQIYNFCMYLQSTNNNLDQVIFKIYFRYLFHLMQRKIHNFQQFEGSIQEYNLLLLYIQKIEQLNLNKIFNKELKIDNNQNEVVDQDKLIQTYDQNIINKIQNIVKVIEDLELQVYDLFKINLDQMSKNYNIQIKIKQCIQQLNRSIENLDDCLQQLQIQKIQLKNNQEQYLYQKISNYVDNKINSSNFYIDPSLKNQLNESFSKINSEKNIDIQDIVQIVQLYIRLLQKSYFVFRNNKIHDKFRSLISQLSDIYKTLSSIQINNIIQQYNRPDNYQNPNDFLIFQLYQMQWMEIDKPNLYGVFNKIKSIFTQQLNNTIEQMNQNFSGNEKDQLSKAYGQFQQQNKLNDISKYEYDDKTVLDNKLKQSQEIKTLFNDYFQDFNINSNQQAEVQKLNISKLEDQYHEQCKSYYFFLSLNYLIQKNYNIQTQMKFEDILSIITRNFDKFQITIQGQKLLLEHNLKTHIKNQQTKFDLSMLQQININDTTDPLQKLILNKINSKIEYSKTFSFYSKKNNMKEVEKCFTIVNKVFLSLKKFALDPLYKDNPSLSILLRFCQKALTFSYDTPLSKIATGLQLISKNIQELNIFLPKHLKLQEEAEEVFNQLYEMRKIEKKSWTKMLILGQNQIENQQVQKIHQQIQSILQSQDITPIALIDEQLIKANLGNFSQQIFLYASLTNQNNKFINKKLLKNLLRYYSVIELEAQKEYVIYNKQIQESMSVSQRLMNWQFRDIVNLKSNMEKLYRGISKSLKAQREIFETRIEQCFIINQRQQNIRNDLSTFIQFFQQLFNYKKDEQQIQYINKSQITNLTQQIKYFEYEDISYFRIISYKNFLQLNNITNVQQNNEFYNTIDHGKIFDEFTSKYLERVDQTKEMKLNFKLRCLKDFLHDLQFFVDYRRFNIQSTFTYRILFENLKIINYNKQIKLLYEDTNIKQDVQEKIQKMNIRIFKVIDCLKNLKQNQIFHDNIPSIFQQKIISLFLEFYIQYIKYTNVIKKCQTEYKNLIDKLYGSNNNLQNKFLFYLQYIQDSEQYSNINKNDLNLIQTYIKKIKFKDNKFEQFFETNELQFLNEFINQLNTQDNNVNIDNSQELKFEQQYSKLRQEFKVFMMSYEEKNFKNFVTKYCDFSRGICEHFKKLNLLIDQYKQQSIKTFKVQNLIKADIQSKVLYCINHLYYFNRFVYNFSIVAQNLLYKGFCYTKKEDEQEEQEISGSEEMDFGTGMGEGQGDSNVADQIEYEEQLLGEMEDNQEQNDQQEQENQQQSVEDSNQMEMENDFGGEDQQQGDDKKEEEEDEKNQEELDQNFEDINQEDLNPQMYQESEEEDNQSQNQQDPKSKFELNNDQKNDEKEDKIEAKEENLKENENQRNISHENEFEEEENSDINSLQEEDQKEDQELEEQFDNNIEEQHDQIQEDIQQEEDQSLSIQQSQQQENSMEIEDDEVIEDDISNESYLEKEQQIQDQQENGMQVEEQEENQNIQQGQPQNYRNQNQQDDIDNNDQQNIENNQQRIEEYMNSKNKNLDDKLIQEIIQDVNVVDQNKEQDEQEYQENKDYQQSQQVQQKQTYQQIKNEQTEDKNKEERIQEDKTLKEILEQKNQKIQDDDEEDFINKKKKNEIQYNNEQQKKKIKQLQENNYQDLSDIINNYENQDKVEEMFEQQNFIDVINENTQLIDQESDLLCEKLKTILDQKQANILKGDFRTGKKLNMKKIIPYIASNYRKNKIWLRKQDPNEKNYSITIAIDNSASMQEKNVGKIALFSSLILCNAIQKAQLGNLQVCKIETGMQVILKDEQFSRFSYQKLINEFNFQYADANSSDLAMANFVKQYLDNVQEENQEYQKICFIVSDGRMNKEFVKKQLLEKQDPEVTFFFVILDSHEFENSIMNYQTSQIIQEKGEIEIIIKNYLEDFPFENYIILKDINHLSNLVVDVLTELMEKNNQ